MIFIVPGVNTIRDCVVSLYFLFKTATITFLELLGISRCITAFRHTDRVRVIVRSTSRGTWFTLLVVRDAEILIDAWGLCGQLYIILFVLGVYALLAFHGGRSEEAILLFIFFRRWCSWGKLATLQRHHLECYYLRCRFGVLVYYLLRSHILLFHGWKVSGDGRRGTHQL